MRFLPAAGSAHFGGDVAAPKCRRQVTPRERGWPMKGGCRVAHPVNDKRDWRRGDVPKGGTSMLSLRFALRFAYGSGARKKIAREFNVSTQTAKMWLSGERHFPLARREVLAERITDRLNERDRLSNEIRRQLYQENWGNGGGEVVDLVVRRPAVAPRDEADAVGR